MDNGDKNTGLVNAVLEQYRIYRGETQSYLSYAVSSTTIFNAFLLAELAAWFKGGSLLALWLLPITTFSYMALLFLLYGYAMIAANYSARLEQRLNKEFNGVVFSFESKFVGPKRNRKGVWSIPEFIPFGILWLFITLLPLILTTYAFIELYESKIVFWLIVVCFVVGFGAAIGSLVQIVTLKREDEL